MIDPIVLHSIEMAFESIDVGNPETAELSEPGLDLLKRFRFQAVETALCVNRDLDETGVAQHTEVLGHGRLRHTKLALDLAYRVLRGDEEAEDGAAIRLSNDLECGFHFTYIPYMVYTCQDI
jgi:hypothetical protein